MDLWRLNIRAHRCAVNFAIELVDGNRISDDIVRTLTDVSASTLIDLPGCTKAKLIRLVRASDDEGLAVIKMVTVLCCVHQMFTIIMRR